MSCRRSPFPTQQKSAVVMYVVVVEDAADGDDDDVGVRRHGGDDLVRDVVHVPRLVALKCYGAYLMLRLL